MTDADIGLCDDCGSDTGRRTATPRQITIAGEAQTVVAWLCDRCRTGALR